VLAAHFETLDSVAERLSFESERQMKAFQKQGILSMIGSGTPRRSTAGSRSAAATRWTPATA
jgi:hypothetical protein